MPAEGDYVNRAVPNDDRIDNKRIFVSASAVVDVGSTGKEVLANARAAPLRIMEGGSLSAYGEMLVRRGDLAGARARFEEARAVVERIPARYYVHLADRALAALPDTDDRSL